MDLIADSLWITENFVSLVESQEIATGDWLGADAIVDEREDDEFEFAPYTWINLDEYDAERVQQAYDSFVYGE